jgi:hypothetical protein
MSVIIFVRGTDWRVDVAVQNADGTAFSLAGVTVTAALVSGGVTYKSFTSGSGMTVGASSFSLFVEEDDAVQSTLPLGRRSVLVFTLANVADQVDKASVDVELIRAEVIALGEADASEITLRIYDNDVTLTLSSLQGPHGAQGDTGAAGPQGEKGETGPQGIFPGSLAVDAVTRTVPLYEDTAAKAAIYLDPRGGAVTLHGDRGPGISTPLHLIVVMGQSNGAVGSDTLAREPAINDVPRRPRRLLMFESCTLNGLQATEIGTLDLTNIVAGYEQITESYATGLVTQLTSYCDARGIATPAWLVLNVARGGASYNVIKKGGTGPSYQNFLDGMAALKEQFNGAVVVDFVVWDHGESNDADSTATYRGRLEEIYDDVQEDVLAVLGQTRAVPFYCPHLPVTMGAGGGQGVQDAVRDLHAEALASAANRRIFCIGPRHQFQYGDTFHLLPAGGLECGALIGQSIAELRHGSAHDNGAFWATGKSIDGNDIVVSTNALYDLELDTAIEVDDRPDFGVEVLSSTASPEVAQEVVDVQPDGTDIRITMALAPAPSWVVRFARSDTSYSAFGPGGRTPIRDTRSTVIALDGETPLKQYMLACEI